MTTSVPGGTVHLPAPCLVVLVGPGASGKFTAQDVARIAAQVPDPAVPAALVSAGQACGIGIADLLR